MNPVSSDAAVPDAPTPPPKAAKPAGPVAPARDERDVAIERLERSVAEERQHSATLREAVEELRFKIAILDKSYAKQLADARLRAEAAERGLAEEKARLAGIDSNHENTLRLLTETRAELARVGAERDLLRKQNGQGARARPEAAVLVRQEPDEARSPAQGDEGTINALMANLAVPRERPAARPESSRLGPQARDENPSPSEEMLSPELVFPKRRDEKQ